jgi:hypothetical protein
VTPQSKQWFIDKTKERLNITHDPKFGVIYGIIGVEPNGITTSGKPSNLPKIAERFKDHIDDPRKTKFTPLPEKLDKRDSNETDAEWEEAINALTSPDLSVA